MNCWLSKRLVLWNKVSSVRPICSLIRFLPSKAASASRTPPHFTRLKKNPSTHHRVHHAPRHAVSPDLSSASPGAEPASEQGHARLWPTVPWPGQSLRQLGAPNPAA